MSPAFGRRPALIAPFLLILASAAVSAQTPELRRIMADPDWIGPPVEAAWWQLDGSAVVYRVKRDGSPLKDLHRVDLETGRDEKLDFPAHSVLDGPDPVFDSRHRRAAFIRDGNLFVRDLASGQLRQLTRSPASDRQPRFSADGRAVHFRRGGDWWIHDLERGMAGPVADLRLETPPGEEPEDLLEQNQLRLFDTLKRAERDRREAHAEEARASAADPSRVPAPWYLGEEHRIVDSRLSPNGRWLLAVTEPAKAEEGPSDRMPEFVTRSGYVEIEDVRTLVGRDAPHGQGLWLLDLEQRQRHVLELEVLEGLDTDPLAELKKTQEITPHDSDNPRPVRVTGIQWHPDGALAAVQFRSVDNKDRWLATLEAESAALEPRHRLSDEAWINWYFNGFGWLPETETLWLLSEESGYSHFYTIDTDSGRTRPLTRGDFEVDSPQPAADGSHVTLIANRDDPTAYDLYRLNPENGELTRLTWLEGVESFALHPGDERILVRHSGPYTPTQISLLEPGTGEIRQLTDTRTEEYRQIPWQQPEFVDVPSRHGAGQPIRSKFYRPDGEAPPEGRPAVLFVHGAGYTQNTHHRFPYYFREQMFHNLLTERGYLVLDMDYRASRGYGRDWRTAIYRNMGTPELEDLRDGVAWLVDHHGADPERIGVYGGSYGGFMSLMAMFRAPETFAAGAALRPVTDWHHYNHGYTSNILNTPEVDPEAHARSSPIEFAAGLQGALLISHGMLDDNVFYKDSVRLAQRLIELEKEEWELASYPLEPHGFEHPESWLDQYRRILKLFERNIGH